MVERFWNIFNTVCTLLWFAQIFFTRRSGKRDSSAICVTWCFAWDVVYVGVKPT